LIADISIPPYLKRYEAPSFLSIQNIRTKDLDFSFNNCYNEDFYYSNKRSKHDDKFLYKLHKDQPIYPRAVKELYNNAGWWPERSEEDIAKMLNSSIAVGEWQRKCLVGFARAVTDNFF
jgi:hypothetical protein